MKNRCGWAKNDLAMRYHDSEWGVPLHDDQKLFEFLILEGAQAGLSWDTILAKRENYRKAFDNFDAEKMAAYDELKLNALVQNAGIVRNRLKIASAVQNAKAYLKTVEEFGSFDRYIWQFVGGKPIVNAWETIKEVPAKTAESDAMSKDLRKRGFKFVSSTICYAFMQAASMVNDHLHVFDTDMKTTKTFIVVIFTLTGLFLTACFSSSEKSERVEFDKACGDEAAHKIITVEGYLQAGERISCITKMSGGRECLFTFSKNLNADERGEITIYIPEGRSSNQVETPEILENKKFDSIFTKENIKIRSNNGTFVTPQDKVAVTGKTELLISSSMVPSCQMSVVNIEKQ